MIVLIRMLVIGLISAGMSDVREPSVSPDGMEVVFCFRGDIWEAPVSGGTMRCLVPGESIETSPSYSPDGRFIAFTSSRSGGGDVYFMDASGGSSTRLTYHAASDRVLCWSADSKNVFFQSSREGGTSWVYSVPVTGGTPSPAARVETKNICLLPRGLAIERGYTSWWRKHYSGSASSRIWTGQGTDWELLDDSQLDSRWPMYSALIDEVLFIREDSDGHAALWSMQAGGEPLQRTFFTDGDITFPSINTTGRTVVFEFNGGLYSLSVPEWTATEIQLVPGADFSFPLEYGESVGYFTDCFDIDSSGTQVAVVGTGDLFAGTIEDGSIENIVQIYAGPWRARDPIWSPDCMTLVFSLEHDGKVQLARSFAESPDSLLTNSTFPEIDILSTASNVAFKPEWAPDGERISYLDRDSRLHVFNVITGHDIRVCDTPNIIHHSWSPDSRMLAFSAPVLAHREEIFIVPSAGGDPRNISRHPNDDFQPLWPDDGRRILYASRTDDGNYSIKQVWFSRDAWDSDSDEREELLDQPLETVDIEWEGLQRRTETLCTVEGYYDFYGASPDGRIIALPGWDDQGRMDLWTVDWKGESLQRVTYSGEYPGEIFVNNEGNIHYISLSGSLRNASVGAGISGTLGWQMPVWRSISSIQAQKFDEAWRLLRDNFYDPGMHEVDWDSIRVMYRERAVSSVINEDFNDVLRRMLGELSASHLGIYGPWDFDLTPAAGSIGIIPDCSWAGPGILVDSVIPFSPADLEGSRLSPGDIILTVHGMDVGPEDNLYRALLQRRNRITRLRVSRSGDLFDVDIEPVSTRSVRTLLYDEWIEQNRRDVARLTGGRIGYLHIPSMSNRSVENFLIDLFAEGLGSDGMIIDVRNNGGGNTHDEIIRELGRPVYMFSTDRHGNVTFEPLGVWQKPLVLLINERCYSDAEIFPGGWKELNLGPVVGETTYGAVIGTSDVTLVDGTGFRIPGTGWFTLTGDNLENSGIEPDIHVPELPADAGQNIDRQLEAAAAAIMDLL
ncbi:MAG: S41 family peptidase [Candidatus Fermentibacteria bacterium]